MVGKADNRIDEWMEDKRTDKPTEVGPEVQMQDVSASSDPPVDLINDGGGSTTNESTPESQEKKRRQEERAETERKKLKVEEKEKQAADLKKERSRDKEEKKKKLEVEEVARKGEKRSGEDAGVDGREDDDGKYQNASSSAAEAPIQEVMAPRVAVKHDMPKEEDEDESPEKARKVASIHFGIGSSDKTGELAEKDYKAELDAMAAAYQSQVDSGSCFVHVRKRHSSNRDLQMLSKLTGGVRLYKVNLHSEEAESVLTNSDVMATLLKEADCQTVEAVERQLEKQVKGKTWEADMETEEREVLNALQSFPFAAWGDVSAAPLNPERVVEARKLVIEYANKKPVWHKISRKQAKEMGWKIVKSRWIDISKGDEENPNYRSRFVGKEFNDGEVEGLFAATPPLEALRLILSWAATGGTGLLDGTKTGETRKCIMLADVSRAFFEAPAKRDLCVELPAEALVGNETAADTVGKLDASLYGTRDASAN